MNRTETRRVLAVCGSCISFYIKSYTFPIFNISIVSISIFTHQYYFKEPPFSYRSFKFF